MFLGLDLALIIAEVFMLACLLGALNRFISPSSSLGVFYDDITSFCQQNNISLSEVAVFLTTALGFIVFDIFLCISEEDVTDVFSLLMLCFVFYLFAFLILGIDVQYYYMISSVSSGDLLARVIIFDVVNNFLCVLRIFFC